MQSTVSNETDVRQKVEETASTVADQAQQVANTQQEKVADTLEGVAQSLRDTGTNMRDQQPQVAMLTDQAATRIDDAASYLRQHTIADLIDQAENIARREPVLFMGAAFALGFIAARFLKASSPNSFNGQGYGYGSQGYGYGSERYSRVPATGYGSSWSSPSTGGSAGSGQYGTEFDGSVQSAGGNYGGSDTTYHSSATQYDMNGNTGIAGVGSDMDPIGDFDTDAPEEHGSTENES